MPIQPMSFPLIDMEGANPALYGALRGQELIMNAIKQQQAQIEAQRAKQMLPLDLQAKLLANKLSGVNAQYAEPLIQQELQKAQLGNQKSTAELPYAGEAARAGNLYKLAMAKYVGSPQQLYTHMTNLGKTITESGGKLPFVVNKNGSLVNNPNYSSAISSEEEPSENMTSSNPSISNADTKDAYRRQIQNLSTDPQLRRDTQNAQALYNSVNDIDIKPLQAFSGAGGKAKLLLEKAKGVGSSLGIGVEPNEDFRKYTAWKAVNQNGIIDTLRKMLATSVQPRYIKNNLYPMLDADGPIWNDPRQVEENVKALQKWVKDYATEKTKAFQKGIPTSLENNKEQSITSALADILGNQKNKNIPENLGKSIQQQGIPSPAAMKTQNPINKPEKIKIINGKAYKKINGEWYEQ